MLLARTSGQSSAALLSGIALLLLPISLGFAAEQKLLPLATKWTVTADFKKDANARTNLSGAACVPTRPPFKSCLIANDEKKYAQFFSIEGTRITPKAIIRLADKDDDGDPDAEGVAYADGYFYVVGSHGRSRHGDKANDSSYSVFRFPVGKTSGRPPFKVSQNEVNGVESSGRLRQALRKADIIKNYYDQPLEDGGVNIEGIAVKDGRMYLGLRGPSRNQDAFILSVDADAAFDKSQDLDTSIRRLKLGKNTGIRDLAAVKGGLLVLSGPVNDQSVAPAVFHWSEKTTALKKLGELQLTASVKKGAKAEILLVLRDKPNEPWRVLIMFDGPANGQPTEYEVPR